jgi:hypothetical protein
MPGLWESLGSIGHLTLILGICLLLLMLSDDPRSRAGRVGELAALAAMGLTGVLIVFFAPWFAWRWWRTRSRHSLAVVAVAAAAARSMVWFSWGRVMPSRVRHHRATRTWLCCRGCGSSGSAGVGYSVTAAF